jgi:aminoglycoside/choline kinase family phosphotransferase
MDAPPANEDCRPWLHVQQLFHEAGVHVPEVLARDLERGFLLLSDLGATPTCRCWMRPTPRRFMPMPLPP